jgi:hypothetical protein
MSALLLVVNDGLTDMGRSLIWIEDDAGRGWACSSCRWRFTVPTLLTEGEAKRAYDRLAAVKHREHECETETSTSAAKLEIERPVDPTFVERARILIKQGFKPKDAVELVLQETALVCRNDARMLEKARADADDFLWKVSRGLI